MLVNMGAGAAFASPDESIFVSTANTELPTHNDVHIQGTPEQRANVTERNMRFIKEIALAAHNSGNEYGLYPSITIAQAVLESGGGTSGLSKAPNYNLFGIKGSYQGQSVSMSTQEHTSSGQRYTIQANFRKYPNHAESLRDHNRLLKYGLNGFYAGAWRENAETPRQAAEHLQGRYATDVNYANKLMEIIERYNLERFDRELTDRDIAWLNSDSLDPWELPVVERERSEEKSVTWASSFRDDTLEFSSRLRAIDDEELESIKEEMGNISPDRFYVTNTLNLPKNFNFEDVDRYKRNPQVGDVAVYVTENGDSERIETYSIIKGFHEDENLVLLAEGTRGERGYREVYRILPEAQLNRFEFIDKDLLVDEANPIRELSQRQSTRQRNVISFD